MSTNQKIIGGALGIFLATFTSASLLLATRTWDPSWNPFGLSTEQILLRSFSKAKDLDSFRTKTNVHADIFRDEEKFLGVSLTTTGDTQRNTQEQNSQGTISSQVELEGIDIAFSAEYRFLGDTLYVKVTTFPALSYIEALLGADLASIKNQWIRIGKNNLEEFGIDTQEQSAQQNEFLNEKIERLIREERAFESIERFADERIGEVSTYHLKVVLRNDALQELLHTSLQTLELNDRQQTQELRSIVASLESVPVDIWIEKQTLVPRKISTQFQLQEDAFRQALFQDVRALVKTEVELSAFNKAVLVQRPETSTPIEEIFETVFGSSLPRSQSAARDARRQSDIQQIGVALELYYNEHGQYPVAPGLPSSIGNILPVTPRDPGNGVPDCDMYQWIPNARNSQAYCVYACLESGGFFVASPRGAFELPVPPPSLEGCQS